MTENSIPTEARLHISSSAEKDLIRAVRAQAEQLIRDAAELTKYADQIGEFVYSQEPEMMAYQARMILNSLQSIQVNVDHSNTSARRDISYASTSLIAFDSRNF